MDKLSKNSIAYQNIRQYKKIIFDCDSTLVKVEGLDEIARFKGCLPQVQELTKLSMEGKVKLEEVFALKMAMIRPSYAEIIKLGELYIESIVEDIREILLVFKSLNKDVIQVTGNFYPAIEKLCDFLNIPKENIFANSIYFNDRGQYIGFDSSGFLSISGGKREIVKRIFQKDPVGRICFVGDGSTDLETAPPVDLFVGYGGVVIRDNVKNQSDAYILSESHAPLLRLILTEEEQRMGEKINPTLFEKADQLIAEGKLLTKNMFT